MPCYKCNGYWVCDGKAKTPGEVCDRIAGWTYIGPVTGPGKVWCRPGSPSGSPCDAKLQEDPPGATPPWQLAGEIGPGNYDMFCRPGGVGGGETCQVKLEDKSEQKSEVES